MFFSLVSSAEARAQLSAPHAARSLPLSLSLSLSGRENPAVFPQAPEILQGHKYGAKADLWSVGAILFEMLAGKPPFGGQNQVRGLLVPSWLVAGRGRSLVMYVLVCSLRR